MYRWLVFLHVLGALGFMLGHGATMGATLLLSKEKSAERALSLIEMARSNAVLAITWISLLVVLVTGIWTGFTGGWWRSWWIWLSLAILVVNFVLMGWKGRGYFDRIRVATGVEPPGEPVSQSELEATLASAPIALLLVVGLGGIAVILYLMMFKPF